MKQTSEQAKGVGRGLSNLKYKERCDEVLLSRNNPESWMVFSNQMSGEEVYQLLELGKEDHFTIPSGMTRKERREWSLSKIKEVE